MFLVCSGAERKRRAARAVELRAAKGPNRSIWIQITNQAPIWA
jgi:hypothetical protein